VERQLASADDFSILQEWLSHPNSSLGEVSVAHDQLIGRIVTFNQIKANLADDIDRWLVDEYVVAYQPSLIERLMRWLRQRS